MAAIILTSTEGLSHADWLAYRNLGIGGSDASVVCGVNKYKSALELWMEKTGQKPPEEAGEAAYWGTLLEPLIRSEFSQRTRMNVIQVKQILQNKDFPFMLANLDGVCRCPIYGKCIFEAKSANAFKAGEWDGDAVPYEYILQLQHYLCVTGYNGAYIAVLVGGNAFQWKFVKRDEELISMLIKYERSFWMHVQDDVPPPADGSDACVKFLNKRYPNTKSQPAIQLPDSAAYLVLWHNEADEQMKIHKEQKQKSANQLRQMLGEYEYGFIGDGYVKWPTIVKNEFNTKQFAADYPEIHAKYMVQSSQRRLTVKEPTNLGESNQPEFLEKAG